MGSGARPAHSPLRVLIQKGGPPVSKWVEQFNGRRDGWGRKLHEKEIRIPVDLVTGILFFALALII